MLHRRKNRSWDDLASAADDSRVVKQDSNEFRQTVVSAFAGSMKTQGNAIAGQRARHRLAFVFRAGWGVLFAQETRPHESSAGSAIPPSGFS
jgi:hypothetical protein